MNVSRKTKASSRACVWKPRERPAGIGGTLYQVQYSLLWGNDVDMVCVVIAGAPAADWETYRSTFKVMSDMLLIDPTRFPRKRSAPGSGGD